MADSVRALRNFGENLAEELGSSHSVCGLKRGCQSAKKEAGVSVNAIAIDM